MSNKWNVFTIKIFAKIEAHFLESLNKSKLIPKKKRKIIHQRIKKKSSPKGKKKRLDFFSFVEAAIIFVSIEQINFGDTAGKKRYQNGKRIKSVPRKRIESRWQVNDDPLKGI